MNKKITVAILGLGNRGNDIYAHYQLVAPEEMQVVAVADLSEGRRKAAQELYGVKAEYCYSTAEELLAQPKLADVCVVATQDKQHVEMAVKAIEKGYHVICEKPISPELGECLKLRDAAHAYNKKVAVGHVLRYTPFYTKMKEIIASGKIGEVVNIQAEERIGYWHQAHAYVRGNWRSSKTTSPIILAKCCHDLDIFCWLLDKKCERVSSFGGLFQFKKEKMPKGAAKRCMDGCAAKENCPYDAEKIYITNKETGIREVLAQGKTGDDAWPVCILSPNDMTEEAIYRQIKEGPYGVCVYQCDNDVVDHQVVTMEFEDHVMVDFTMSAFTSRGGRTIHISGTHGDIVGDMENNAFTLTEFGKEPVIISASEGDMSGHAGGDNRLIHDFLSSLDDDAEELRTGIDASIQSHVIAIAAEYSRKHQGALVELDEFMEKKLYEGEV